jgi:hypothetical protein
MVVWAVSGLAPAPIGIISLKHVVLLPIWFVANVICSIAATSGLTRQIENPSVRSLVGLFLSGFFFVFNFEVVAHFGFSRIEGLVF